MLPPLASVLRTHAFLKIRYRWRWDPDAAGIAEALREAESLAGGRPEDEPAALLFAFTRHKNDLADAWETLPFVFAKNLVREALHAELLLTVDDPALHALRMRIIEREPAKRASFDEVRAFLAARLRR
jgi:hypothetical protein